MTTQYGRWNSEGKMESEVETVLDRNAANVNHRAAGCISLIVLVLFVMLAAKYILPMLG